MVPVVYVIKHLKAIIKTIFQGESYPKSFVHMFVTCRLNFPISSNCDILLLYMCFRFSKKAFGEELAYILHFTLTTKTFFEMIFIGCGIINK